MTNLMHNYVVQNVYYCNPLHVSSNTVLIITRSNCINTASGILFSVSDCPVCTPEGRCINTIRPPDDEHSVARNM